MTRASLSPLILALSLAVTALPATAEARWFGGKAAAGKQAPGIGARVKGWLSRGKAAAKAQPAAAVAVAGKARTIMPLTRETLAQRYAGKSPEAVNSALRQGQWRPSDRWLSTVGQRYGRLLIVNDLHPSTGRNPITRKVSPAEDFKNDQQEVDFRRMMKQEWRQSATDGKARTIVLNGDVLEFMQTDRAGTGSSFKGLSDRYGPLNSPENIVTKLNAIYQGHPTLFSTYAEHLVRGHRVVYVPGNHDRQLLHPTVRRALLDNLARDASKLLLADKAFAPGVGKHSRRKAAARKARQLVGERFEFHPWFFMVGDVVARHGHETDQYNSFGTPFGEYYHPGSRKASMEAALGDYIVKGVFNKVERRKPWTDNTSRSWPVIKAVIQASDYNPIKAVRFLKYLLTREGSDRSKRGVAKAQAQLERDVVRYVREFKLLDKFNEIRPRDQQLNEKQLVQTLLAYERAAAPPALSHYDRKHGTLRRLPTLAKRLPQFVIGERSHQRETRMADKLFENYISTLSVGHDHQFRVEPRLVVDNKTGQAARATVLDAATWTDQLPEIRRDTGFVPTARRGVVVVDFDAKGSHARLMNFDPVRGLQSVSVLESEKEALHR